MAHQGQRGTVKLSVLGGLFYCPLLPHRYAKRRVTHERPEGIFGPADIRKEEAGIKKLWHYGVDGKDGLVGYSDLHRDVRTAKAAAQGRSPEGLSGQ